MVRKGSYNTAQVNIASISVKTLSPPFSKYLIDVSKGLRDPHGRYQKSHKDSRDPDIVKWTLRDPVAKLILKECEALAFVHLKRMKDSFVSFTFKDHHGRWLSVAMAEALAKHLEEDGITVSVDHHELPY